MMQKKIAQQEKRLLDSYEKAVDALMPKGYQSKEAREKQREAREKAKKKHPLTIPFLPSSRVRVFHLGEDF